MFGFYSPSESVRFGVGVAVPHPHPLHNGGLNYGDDSYQVQTTTAIIAACAVPAPISARIHARPLERSRTKPPPQPLSQPPPIDDAFAAIAAAADSCSAQQITDRKPFRKAPQLDMSFWPKHTPRASFIVSKRPVTLQCH